MMLGLMASANGACPHCGENCARTHGFNGIALTDRYHCSTCGDTVYLAAWAAA